MHKNQSVWSETPKALAKSSHNMAIYRTSSPHKACSATHIWSATHDFGSIYTEKCDLMFAELLLLSLIKVHPFIFILLYFNGS